jgi:CrcB protein
VLIATNPDARAVSRPLVHPLHLSVLLAVALGGTFGACARYGLGLAFPDSATGFPWTTFAINVAGSGALAALPASGLVRRHVHLPPLLGTGVLGGFTTMSTNVDQCRALLASGRAGIAATYLVGTLACCMLAVALADRLSTLPARAEFEDEEGDL